MRVDEQVSQHQAVLGVKLEGGKNLRLQIDGLPLAVLANESGIGAVNLCALPLNSTHVFTAVLHDGSGAVQASSEPVTFELRKLAPKVTVTQPLDGGVDFARSGFTLFYRFEPGYDSAQVAITLNGTALAGPMPSEAGTHPVPLPAESLRDGVNELLVAVTMEGYAKQTSVVRFSTQAAATPPQSKGGALEAWSLALLALLRVLRVLRLRQSATGRITPMRVAWSRPRSR